ncbi:olfactory receptor 5V1-like [Ascaphus truei]|uniref:olfactory receptor 5V1-like n=1 Tax=Ascaphus truei TaxID=8439 RepID=UPI003F593C24
MERDNVTSVQTFILLGFSHLPHLRLFLVSVFSLLYIFTLLGNGLIIILIKTDHRLHTPMYFFLANLSLMDLLYPSVTVPKMIWDLVFREGVISFHGCIAQLFFFITFASNECLFLSVMAFDRYLAICKPLHYGTIMSHRMCLKLTGGAWVTGFLYSVIHTVLTNSMLFCGPNLINHFFCDIPPLFQLACSDITFNMMCVFVSVFVMGVCNFSITLSSYTGIVTIILRIKSREGRMKAVSTCASHLMVVSMYYGTLLITYFRPMSSYSQSRDRTAAVIYTTVTPVLNPVIYSLRNKDVKRALKKILWKGAIS